MGGSKLYYMGMPKPGDIYTGFGKRWRVLAVEAGTVRAENVDRPSNTIRWPIERFKEMAHNA